MYEFNAFKAFDVIIYYSLSWSVEITSVSVGLLVHQYYELRASEKGDMFVLLFYYSVLHIHNSC